MSKLITVKLTLNQWNDVIRGTGYLMSDYMDEYTDDPNSLEAKNNRRVDKENAKIQKLVDNMTNQVRNQVEEL